MAKLKVLSQNVMSWGVEGVSTFEMRRPVMKAVIEQTNADIIGFQEVVPTWEEYFKEDLAQYRSYLVYRSKTNLEATPIYWNSERITAIETGHFWLSETPEIESFGWDAKCVRTACWGLFQYKETGERFVFINTHLDHIGETARINGICQICSFIKDNFGENIPLILTGDFNALPNSKTIETANGLLCDTRAIAEITTQQGTWHEFGKRESETIDYIYVSRGLKCKRFEVITEKHNSVFQSDHSGIFAELEF